MNHIKSIAIVLLIFISQGLCAQTKKAVAPFNKVIISPHIETTFVQGNEASVTILENTLSDDIVHIEVHEETLKVYLEDAKLTTKHKKVVIDGMKKDVPIYKGKVLTIQVTYKDIDHLSLRGEQRFVCESPIYVDTFKLKIYGKSEVIFNDVNFKDFDVDMYGDSQLTIQKGTTENQKITAYGEGEVNLVAVDNTMSKLKAYGETQFRVQASKRIKFSAIGEAELYYKGTAKVHKGLSIGDSKINRID